VILTCLSFAAKRVVVVAYKGQAYIGF